MSPIIRCLQGVTVAAIVFELLGACGIPPPRRGPVALRPRRPGPAVTIRSLTGDWEAVHGTTSGPRILRLRLVQTGDLVRGTLMEGDRTWPSDPNVPARLDASGWFSLPFGHSHEIFARGRVDVSGDWFSLEVTGLERQPVSLVFQRL